MDCPACHVSIPRSDFRRCVVLDEVVDKAVIAAGLDDEEWRARIERGQKLAKEAEAGRRRSRDAQRKAEDTIAQQAAELERLREEARARAPGRWRRPNGGLPSSMTDFGFRVMDLDPASQRSTMEELARLRHRRAERGETLSSRGASVPSEAAAAATLGMSPGLYGSVRSRSQQPSAPFGPAGEDPWFSLRPSQSSRHAGLAMSGSGRMGGRDGFARSNAAVRSAGYSAATGPEPSAGAVLKTAQERDGSTWRPAYLGTARPSRDAPGEALPPSGGGRSRNSALSSLHTMVGVPAAGSSVGAPLERGAAAGGRRSSALGVGRFTRKRVGFRGQQSGTGAAAAATPASSAASASASYSAAAGGSAPLGPSHGLVLNQREASSSGGGGGGGGGSGRFSSGVGGVTVGSAAGATPRFNDTYFDMEPLDMISRNDEFGTRSEWDDVLAAVSLPHPGADDGLGHEDSPERGRH